MGVEAGSFPVRTVSLAPVVFLLAHSLTEVTISQMMFSKKKSITCK